MRAGIDCDYTDEYGRPREREAHLCLLITLRFSIAADNAAETYRRAYPDLARRFPLRSPP